MLGGKAVKRIYEKTVKGSVYCVSGGPGHKMQLPKDERRGRAFVVRVIPSSHRAAF